jgi:hypothetical protein
MNQYPKPSPHHSLTMPPPSAAKRFGPVEWRLHQRSCTLIGQAFQNVLILLYNLILHANLGRISKIEGTLLTLHLFSTPLLHTSSSPFHYLHLIFTSSLLDALFDASCHSRSCRCPTSQTVISGHCTCEMRMCPFFNFKERRPPSSHGETYLLAYFIMNITSMESP